MRGVASLIVLGLMMALFHHLTAAGPLEGRAAFALGLLLVAAWLAGVLARRARLPRITGFLLAGLSLGPAWLHVVRADEVGALGFVQDAAVALLAFAAGSALPLATLRAERAGLGRLATGTILFPFGAVTLVVLSVSRWFPLSVHQPFGNALGVALTLGTVAAASSPILTIAVLDELDARGPFARGVLAVSAVKDVTLIALLAAVLVVARLVGSAGAVHLGAAARALGGLAGSLAVGLAVGAAVAEFLRRTRADATLGLVALAFVAALVARNLHGDALLVTLAAGFYVGSVAPPQAERLRAEMNRAAVSVYAVSFTVAGAGLRLDALAELWPWVLLLAGLRTVALRYGTLWAGRSTSVTPALAREGWLGLISQSGVILGFGAVARQAFPAWGVSLEALVLASVAVHEVAGPICLRRALGRAGEFKEEAHDGEESVAGPALGGGVGGGLQRRSDWPAAGRLPFVGATGRAERGRVHGARPSAHGRMRGVPRGFGRGLGRVPARAAGDHRECRQ